MTEMAVISGKELLRKDRILAVHFEWSAGPYLSRFLQELRDNGKLWAVRCPRCKRLLMPPRIVCASCYTETPRFPKGWIKLSGNGTLEMWEKSEYTQMNPETGKLEPERYLHGQFKLDEGAIFHHYLGPETLDYRNLKNGMKVRMVMKPRRQRVGKMTDIRYFQLVEGQI